MRIDEGFTSKQAGTGRHSMILTRLCQRIYVLFFRVDLRETKTDILRKPLHAQKGLLELIHVPLCINELFSRYHLVVIVPILGGEVNVIY